MADRRSIVVCFAVLAAMAWPSWGQWRPKDTEWPTYTADLAGTRYRPLDQINASNFGKLEVAWRFKTDNLGTRPEYKLEGTPLMVNGVIYATGGTRRAVVALDARTGETIWVHSVREGNRAAVSPRQLSGRGLAYWSDSRGDDRVVYVTTGYRRIADHRRRVHGGNGGSNPPGDAIHSFALFNSPSLNCFTSVTGG